ncbi:oxidoreductase [Kribbella turkmenica]|uniref:Oxidoreductase n=1 Tax=Kribbella turkmenica TaxID=2530375 RepID=A0A4R4XEW7_9ACTN|nr:PDR/VanB family oxidoreductase [Kribbella turkmenica]TDD29230.1 oxidoreductase [Kribbella turkmenica]
MDERSSNETIDLVVVEKALRAADVVEIALRARAGDKLPRWDPGAHIDLVLPVQGTGTLIRQYSLCGDPEDSFEWRVAILREPAGRGGSRYIHDHLAEGAAISARGPRNLFPLDCAHDYLFIAGGIGITPIIPMVDAVEADRLRWSLYYAGRRRARMAFVEELTSRFGERVHVIPEDECGMPDLGRILSGCTDKTAVYCCGPAPMLDAVASRCHDLGLPPPHLERFSAPQAPAGESRPVEVEFRRLGITRTVTADESILDVAEELGSEVFGSCREGICGTCETRVLEGTPDHRDSVLSDEQRADRMMICVSRATSARLVLDA